MKTVLTEKYNLVDSSKIELIELNFGINFCSIIFNCNSYKITQKIVDKVIINHKVRYDDNSLYVITNKRKLKIKSLFTKYIDKTYKYDFN